MNIVEYCRSCYHWSTNCCLYILNTGHRRPCPAGGGCTEKITKREWLKMSENANLSGFEPIANKRRPRTNWTPAMLDELRRHREAGLTVNQIADRMGLDAKAVSNKIVNAKIVSAPEKSPAAPKQEAPAENSGGGRFWKNSLFQRHHYRGAAHDPVAVGAEHPNPDRRKANREDHRARHLRPGRIGAAAGYYPAVKGLWKGAWTCRNVNAVARLSPAA